MRICSANQKKTAMSYRLQSFTLVAMNASVNSIDLFFSLNALMGNAVETWSRSFRSRERCQSFRQIVAFRIVCLDISSREAEDASSMSLVLLKHSTVGNDHDRGLFRVRSLDFGDFASALRDAIS